MAIHSLTPLAQETAIVPETPPLVSPDTRTAEGKALQATIRGSSDEFDEAMGDFAVAYADQAEKDHAALKQAVPQRTIVARQEEDE